jgi:hypothetical protein
MRNQRIILAFAIIAKLILSVLICMYFWNSTELIQIKQIPVYLLVMSVVYIGLQMYTRKISTVHNWWDWVYYIGLVSIMVPVSIATSENEKIIHLVTDIGTICLILPVLADGYFFIGNTSNKGKK